MTEPKRSGRRPDRPGRAGRATGNDNLRAVLRRGDPDRDGRAPSTAEHAALRRLIVDAAGASAPPVWGRVPALASALIIVVMLAAVSLFWFRPGGNDSPPRLAGRAAVEHPAAGGATIDRSPDGSAVAGGRSPAGAGDGAAAGIDGNSPPSICKVQFVTSGGTRIVWVLNRNLDI